MNDERINELARDAAERLGRRLLEAATKEGWTTLWSELMAKVVIADAIQKATDELVAKLEAAEKKLAALKARDVQYLARRQWGYGDKRNA